MTLRRLRLAPLLAATLAGCATVTEFPTPFGGVRRHVEILSGRGHMLDEVVWWVLFPVSVSDLCLSLTADVALLPLTGPPGLARAWVEWRSRRLREPTPARPAPPRPAPVPDRAAHERALAVARAQQAREQQARELRDAVAAVDALATTPAERARLAALSARLWPPPGAVVDVSRVEDGFWWLPAGPVETPEAAAHLDGLLRLADGAGPTARIAEAHVAERAGDVARALAACDAALDVDPLRGPAWTVRGWARLREGDLARAEADLRLGRRLCLDPLNVAWATIGLGRVAEARGRPDDALRLYREVLADERVARDLASQSVDHASDLRARMAALETR